MILIDQFLADIGFKNQLEFRKIAIAGYPAESLLETRRWLYIGDSGLLAGRIAADPTTAADFCDRVMIPDKQGFRNFSMQAIGHQDTIRFIDSRQIDKVPVGKKAEMIIGRAVDQRIGTKDKRSEERRVG